MRVQAHRAMLPGMERSIASRIRNGDGRAFAEAVHACEARLYRIGLSMTRNPEDARDILQDTLLSAWRALPTLQDDTRVEAWLCRIATNSARMLLRSRRRRPVVPMEEVEETYDATGHRIPETTPWNLRAEDTIDRSRLATRIAEHALSLPDEYREVWALADVEQLSMVEIAEILDLTVPNVKTRLHRARLALRRQLAGEMAG